mgnify:CR=1 FL=1
MAKGIIYVMTTVVPGLIKIGKTGSDNFENRMYQLERNGYFNVVGLKRKFAIEVEDYDAKEKKYIDSDKNYSGHEYDNARKNILEYLKVDNIDEYINKLTEKDKKTKKVQNLIDLRDSLKDKDIRLMQYEQELIKENMELKESINNTTRRAM